MKKQQLERERERNLLFSGPESLKMGFGHRELDLLTEGREGTKKSKGKAK